MPMPTLAALLALHPPLDVISLHAPTGGTGDEGEMHLVMEELERLMRRWRSKNP